MVPTRGGGHAVVSTQANQTGRSAAVIILHEIFHEMTLSHINGFRPDGGVHLCQSICHLTYSPCVLNGNCTLVDNGSGGTTLCPSIDEDEITCDGSCSSQPDACTDQCIECMEQCLTDAFQDCGQCHPLNLPGTGNSNVYQVFDMEYYVNQALSASSYITLEIADLYDSNGGLCPENASDDAVGKVFLGLSNQWMDNYVCDVLPNFNCGAGIWEEGVNEPEYLWQYRFCDEPEEICNNIMSYGYYGLGAIPINVSCDQIQKLHRYLDLNPNVVLSNDQIIQAASTPQQSLCGDNILHIGLAPSLYDFSWSTIAPSGSALSGNGLSLDLQVGSYSISVTAVSNVNPSCAYQVIQEVDVSDPECADGLCYTEDILDPETCECSNIGIEPDCNDDLCYTVDSYDPVTCECSNLDGSVPLVIHTKYGGALLPPLPDPEDDYDAYNICYGTSLQFDVEAEIEVSNMQYLWEIRECSGASPCYGGTLLQEGEGEQIQYTMEEGINTTWIQISVSLLSNDGCVLGYSFTRLKRPADGSIPFSVELTDGENQTLASHETYCFEEVSQGVLELGLTLQGGSGFNSGHWYQWLQNDQIVSEGTDLQSFELESPTAGSFTYTVNVFDQHNSDYFGDPELIDLTCSASDSVIATVHYMTDSDLGTLTACVGSPLQMSVESDTGLTYLWEPAVYLSDVNVSNPTFLSDELGVFDYTLTVTDVGSACTSVTTVSVENLDWIPAPSVPYGDELQDITLRISGMITVEAGAELLIKDSTFEFLDETSGILVEAGGRLVIKGESELKSAGCGSDSWYGIRVAGHCSAPETNNGVVEISGTSTQRPIIRDALIGIGSSVCVEFAGTEFPNSLADIDKYGGDVKVEYARFINNRTAIRFRGNGGVSSGAEHYIKNCEFTNDAFFTFDEAPTHVKFEYCKYPKIDVTGNEFRSELDLGQMYGTGIRSLESLIRIGQMETEDGSAPSRNTFENLFKGIDTYNVHSAHPPLLYHNSFINVVKGITVNTCASAEILNNDFEIPSSVDINDDGIIDNQDEHAYGVWMESSSSFTLESNTYRTLFNSGDNYGLVVKDSYLSDNNGSRVSQQFFDGAFAGATVFSGVNTMLEWECNKNGFIPDSTEELSPPKADWIIDDAPTDENESSATVVFGEMPNPQGGAITPKINNKWHEEQTGLHIKRGPNMEANNITLRLQIYCDDSSVPSLFGDGVEPETILIDPNFNIVCGTVDGGETTGEPTNPDDTDAIIVNDSDCHFPTNISEVKPSRVSRALTLNVRDNKEECVHDLLAAQDANWSKWIRVGSYVGVNKLESADEVMKEIDIVDERDSQLRDVYSPIIDDYLHGNGKLNDVEHEFRSYSKKGPVQSLAESVLACAFNESYNRNFHSKYLDSKSIVSDGDAISHFTVYPNPAGEFAYLIYLPERLAYEAEIRLYDLTGQCHQSWTMSNQRDGQFDIRLLQNGVYFLEIQGPEFQEVHKIIIHQ